jgi:hypothetical protein
VERGPGVEDGKEDGSLRRSRTRRDSGSRGVQGNRDAECAESGGLAIGRQGCWVDVIERLKNRLIEAQSPKTVG